MSLKPTYFITFPIARATQIDILCSFHGQPRYDQVPDESAPPPKEGEKQKMKSVPRSVYELLGIIARQVDKSL